MKNFLTFEEAREYVRSLNLKNAKDWFEYCSSGKKPENIPSNLWATYKNKGWTSLGDFLGTGTIATRNYEFLTFEEARELIRSMKIRSYRHWIEIRKSNDFPKNIPSNPYMLYKDKGWTSWGDFLGNHAVPNRFNEYRTNRKEALNFASKIYFE